MLILWLLAAILILLTAYNIHYLRFFKSRVEKLKSLEEKDLYYKLDSKIELLKYLAIGLITIASIFGYSKFKDISNRLSDFENLESRYNSLNQEYDRLVKLNDELGKSLEDIRSSFIDFTLERKELEAEFIRMEYKIKEATRKIPEANIRILTKQLVETNLRDVGTKGIWIDSPDSTIVHKELLKSINMLRNAGFSQGEIDEIIKELQKDYKWVK